jgi:hypothetical protein
MSAARAGLSPLVRGVVGGSAHQPSELALRCLPSRGEVAEPLCVPLNPGLKRVAPSMIGMTTCGPLLALERDDRQHVALHALRVDAVRVVRLIGRAPLGLVAASAERVEERSEHQRLVPAGRLDPPGDTCSPQWTTGLRVLARSFGTQPRGSTNPHGYPRLRVVAGAAARKRGGGRASHLGDGPLRLNRVS